MHEEKDELEKIREDYEEKLKRLRDDYDRYINTMRREMREIRDRLAEAEMLLQKYEDAFSKIKKPPLIYAYVTRKKGSDLKKSQIVVARGNELLKVELSTSIKKESLRIGQYLWVHPQTYAVIEVTDQMHPGIVGKVIEILEVEEKMVVSIEGEAHTRIIDLPKGFGEHLKAGYQVVLLPPTMEILDILPNWEVKLLLLGEKPTVRYNDIGGLDESIERIKDVIVLPYQQKDLFDKVNLNPPRGILLYGPPGCGKTLLVKAVAAENDMTFFNVSIADILSKWVGESERIIKELFRQAKERRPSIIFFDEIEALFTVRGLLDTSGVHKNIIAQILSEMDGITDLKGVYVIGATNRPDLVDPALLRPKRFDEIIEIPRPDRKAANEILEVYLTDDLPVEHSLIKKFGSKKETIKFLRQHIIDEIYGDDKWISVKLDPEAKEAVKTVLRRDVISGAVLEAIVTTAKKNYIKRVMNKYGKAREKDGLTIDDLDRAIEEETREHAITELSTYERRQRDLKRPIERDPMVT